ALFGRGGFVSTARAQDGRAPTGASVSPCVLRGAEPVPKGTQLFDAASGGRAIANFTGAKVPLQLSQIPADPTIGRARVSTSAGGSSVRIDGYGSPSAISTYTTRDLPLAAGHVWISSAQKVKLVQASGSTLTAELTILGSANQAIRASGPCEAF